MNNKDNLKLIIYEAEYNGIISNSQRDKMLNLYTEKTLVNKNTNILPDELTKSSKKSYGDGLIRFCSPNTLSEFFYQGYPNRDAIIFGTTAFGDFLVFEKNKYINLVSFYKNRVSVLGSDYKFFIKDLEDKEFLEKRFNYKLYMDAKKKLGACSDTECYTINPIPAIGGRLTLDALDIGKMREYTTLCISMAGKII